MRYTTRTSDQLQRHDTRRLSLLISTAWLIALLPLSIWLYAFIYGPSIALAQSFGLGLLAAMALHLVITLQRRPQDICRPVTLFCIGCIYFFLLDAAFLLHGVSEFDPTILLLANTLIAAFLVLTIVTHRVVRFRGSLIAFLFSKPNGRHLSGRDCYIVVFLAVGLECVRRLTFVDFNLSRLWHDLLLGRGAGAFRIGVADDWRVMLAPIEVLFLSATLFADLAWRHSQSALKKACLLLLIGVQLTILVIDTVRGDLLMALLMPILIRGTQNDRSVGRLLGLTLLGLPVVLPLMNVMNYARNGWFGLQVGARAFQEPGEDDFFWLTNLVAYRSQVPGLFQYKGPLGFAEGLAEIGREWVTIAVPRALWRDKPRYWEKHYETRGWYAADSVVGDLFAAGGVSCVIGGAILFGVWLSVLDAACIGCKSNEEAVAYVFLALSVVSLTRDAVPFNTVPLLLGCLLLITMWRMFRFVADLGSGRSSERLVRLSV